MSTSRPYAHPADLVRLLDFVRSVRPPERIGDYPGLVDLEELLARPEIREKTRLWLGPQGGLSAYAILSQYNNLQFDIVPARLEAIGAEIVQWAVELAKAGEGDCVYTSCSEDNPVRQAFLQSHGFELQPDYGLHYVRSLHDPIPDPTLPRGFSIRPLVGKSEAEAAATLHRAAFGTDYMTTGNRLALMHTSAYVPEMDLVAVAPDGRLAAYTLGSINSEENARTGRKDGHTDPVATHPDFQRLGLARALLLTCMRMLKERGMETAKLGTGSDNTAMQKTAESAGFVIESRILWLRKPVE